MIVRDEEDVLARSIACALAVADEVKVVDTGSADGSAAIARAAGAKVYDFEWRDDFSAARNYSFSLASGEYIMWLDADDVIECEDAEQIRRLVAEGGFDVAMLGYRSGDLEIDFDKRLVWVDRKNVLQQVGAEVVSLKPAAEPVRIKQTNGFHKFAGAKNQSSGQSDYRQERICSMDASCHKNVIKQTKTRHRTVTASIQAALKMASAQNSISRR